MKEKNANPRGYAQGGMVTTQIEPFIWYKLLGSPTLETESLLVKW